MKRHLEEIHIAKRRLKEHRRFRQGEKSLGRFRKRDAHDCGNTRCGVCHWDKYPKRTPTRQEEKTQLSFREQIKGVG